MIEGSCRFCLFFQITLVNLFRKPRLDVCLLRQALSDVVQYLKGGIFIAKEIQRHSGNILGLAFHPDGIGLRHYLLHVGCLLYHELVAQVFQLSHTLHQSALIFYAVQVYYNLSGDGYQSVSRLTQTITNLADSLFQPIVGYTRKENGLLVYHVLRLAYQFAYQALSRQNPSNAVP